MDKDAYAEYQKMGQKDDGGLSALKYLTNWYAGAVKKDPLMVDTYEKQSKEYTNKPPRAWKGYGCSIYENP